MVGTIAPLVQGRKKLWLTTASVFAVLSTASGGMVGLAIGSLRLWLLPSAGLNNRAMVAVLVGFSLLAAGIDLGIVSVPIPTLHRSVPQRWWMLYPSVLASAAYGSVLGIGLTTVIPIAGFHLVLLISVIGGTPVGLFVGGAYGFGRSVAIVLASLGIGLGANPAALGRWLISQMPTTRIISGLACAAFGLSLLSAIALG